MWWSKEGMAQQSARRGRKNQMYSSCLQYAFMIWFRSANSHTGRSSIAASEAGQMAASHYVPTFFKKPLTLGGASDEYTPFCNGPDEVKSPRDRHAAELTLLSVVDAEAATLCC